MHTRPNFYRGGLLLVVVGLALAALFSPARPASAQQPTPPPAPNSGSNLSPQLYINVNFSNLSFSTTSNGPMMNYFPVGTQEIFARFDYSGIPAGSVLVRQWYLNGALWLQRQDPWSSLWGYSGRLNSISIFDRINGLDPGYYHVVISLQGYPAAQIVGDFVIAGYPVTVPPPVTYSQFSNLTVSTSPAGPAQNAFPAGTQVVSARWDYANIPIGAIVQRDWYLNGVLVRSAQDTWSSYWGSSGRLTHIALYDYQRGLDPGNYRLVVYLRDYPAVRTETAFVIGSVVTGGVFTNLTFGALPDGPPIYQFSVGIAQIFARWDYVNPPSGATIVRRWYRNGILWLERRELWTATGTGHVNNVSIYDFTYGLLPGDYYVQIGLEGVPGTQMAGYFRIG